MSANVTLRRRIAAYGASSRNELLDELTSEIRKVRAEIAEAEGRYSWPEISSELTVLEGRLVELRDRYEATSATASESGPSR